MKMEVLHIAEELVEPVSELRSSSSSPCARLNNIRKICSTIESDSFRIGTPIRIFYVQLILDNVLNLLMNEDRSVDVRRRQLIRIECFAILSQMLASKYLYGDISKRLENTEFDMKTAVNVTTLTNEPKIQVLDGNMGLFQRKEIKISDDVESSFRQTKSKWSAETNESPISSLWKSQYPFQTQKSTGNLNKFLLQTKMSSSHSNLNKSKKRLIRSGMIYGDRMRQEPIVPGVDPFNWQEQDRLLGYSKPKTWYPFPALSHPQTATTLPGPRPSALKRFKPDDIVEEYLQMRAMLSYVGDLILPQRDIQTATGLRKTGEEPYVNVEAYNVAIQDALQLWTPLLGAHAPHWMKGRKVAWMSPNMSGSGSCPPSKGTPYNRISMSSTAPSILVGELASTSVASSVLYSAKPDLRTLTPPVQKIPPSDKPGLPPAELGRSILFTKGILRRLLRKELFYRDQTRSTLRRTLEDLAIRGRLQTVRLVQKQEKMHSSLQSEHEVVSAQASILHTLMRETIKLQYATLPPRYLLVVEGNYTNSRKVVARALDIFYRVKSRNYLALAFGILKMHSIHSRSIERRPVYARAAAVYLMNSWVIRLKAKQMKELLKKWKKIISKLIFLERMEASLSVQTVFRRWRDRRKLIAINELAPYRGPLSDIYLAPQRQNIVYFIPYVVRTIRRMYWLAAIVIQKYFRRYKYSQDYIYYRRQIVLIQSLLRMFPKREQYRRLKRTTIKCQAWMRRTLQALKYKVLKVATIIVQTYVRRYLRILLKLRILDAKWDAVEKRMQSAIKIECRWRIKRAGVRTSSIRSSIHRRDLAALCLQKQWYKSKGAFHTFLLMSCYRVCEEEDKQFAQKMIQRGRYYASRKVQREYKRHYFKRIISAVVKVQCWYRGRLGYTLVSILRREKWAARKLHHWARVQMKYRHIASHKIAHCWLKSRRGRLLQHLRLKAQLQDEDEDRIRRERRYQAAARIQANIKGIWARRWVRRHRAALRIQKPLKFFLARKRWIRKIRDRLLNICKSVVNTAIARAVVLRTRALVKLHSQMLIQAQKWIRGHLIRLKMLRARVYGYRYGLAVVRVQRFWRDSGAFVKAVEEVLTLKRMEANPFRAYNHLHHLLNKMFTQTNRYYNLIDPRAGMSVSSFLYRLGMYDLMPMFPKREYRYVVDLHHLDMAKLISLFHKWRSKDSDTGTSKEAADSNPRNMNTLLGRGTNPPKSVFKELLTFTQPVIPPSKLTDITTVRNLHALPEVFSELEFYHFFTQAFVAKFGKMYTSRSDNIIRYFLEKLWTDWNNFKSLGKVTTAAHILRAIQLCGGPADVKGMVDWLSSQVSDLEEERRWDDKRLSECVTILQYAAERAKTIVEAGTIYDMIEETSVIVAKYKRRFLFRAARLAEYTARSRKLSKPGGKSSSSSGNIDDRKESVSSPSMAQQRKNSVMSFISSTSGNSQQKMTSDNLLKSLQQSHEAFVGDISEIVPGLLHKKIIIHSLRAHFKGNASDVLGEMNLSICKLYLHIFHILAVACHGISALKRHWRRKVLEKLQREEQLKKFLADAKQQYLKEKHTNHVQLTWNKFRKKETMEHRLQLIHKARQNRLSQIRENIKHITKHGWEQAYDEDWNVVWQKVTITETMQQVEMPVYSPRLWDGVVRVQRRARKFIEIMREKRRVKAELVAKQKEAARLAWEKLIYEGTKSITLEYQLGERDLVREYEVSWSEKAFDDASERDKSFESKLFALQESSTKLQSEDEDVPYPYDLRFEECEVKSDMWAVYELQNGKFETVLVFRIRKGGSICDVRTKTNEYIRNVPTKRILHVRLGVGSEVESRYRGTTILYKGLITNVHTSLTGLKYTVLYDDGEKEFHIPREYIRPTTKEIESFLKEREKFKAMYLKQQLRKKYYRNLREERERDRRRHLGDNAHEIESHIKDVHDERLMPGRGLERFLKSTHQLRFRRFTIDRLRIRYTRLALRFPWVRKHQKGPNSSSILYYNPVTYETLVDPPFYTSEEVFYASKIQSVWLVYLARRQFHRLLWKDGVDQIAQRAIDRYQKIAFIGFNLEGVNYLQILRRAGCWDVADCITDMMSKRPGPLKSMKLEQLLKVTPDMYKNLGLFDEGIARRFKRFQDWWKSTPEEKRTQELSFVNYYHDPHDERDLSRCITESHHVIQEQLLSAFERNPSRVQAMCTAITKSAYPVTKLQLRSFIEKYEGKAASAQDNIQELVNKQTTHTWKEEREAYTELKYASMRIGIVLKNMGIDELAERVRKVEALASEIVSKISRDKKRPLYSGPEARAAWILRTEVLGLVIKAQKAAATIQTFGRGLAMRSKWRRMLGIRKSMVKLIQRVYRGSRARKMAAYLRLQQYSNWEQLWDDRNNCFYYFNLTTNDSTYETPTDPYRPLVRHLKSALLIQAWPFLDEDPSYGKQRPTSTDGIPPHLLCDICSLRKAVKVCDACPPPHLDPSLTMSSTSSISPSYYSPKKTSKSHTSFCFPCFSRRHCLEENRSHPFREISEVLTHFEPVNKNYLQCCECGEPATRKCLGVLDEKMIDELCTKLHSSKPSEWMDILMSSRVAGEKKLQLLIQQFQIPEDAAPPQSPAFTSKGHEFTLSQPQIHSIKSLLERTRAECDECYCDSCYVEVHSGGKRATHVWRGFFPYCAVCAVCSKSPAELQCTDCGYNCFCGQCFKVFHGKGRKRKHLSTPFVEEASEQQSMCLLCFRRVATEFCGRCGFAGCNSCYECYHKPQCDADEAAREAELVQERLCILCGQPADKKCVQCGDLYCSRIWMGNPGCFVKFHHKGNRLLHTTEELPPEAVSKPKKKQNRIKHSSVRAILGSRAKARRFHPKTLPT